MQHFYKTASLDRMATDMRLCWSHSFSGSRGASRANVTSQWRNMTVGQIMVLPNYVIVTSKTLCSLHEAWKRMRPASSMLSEFDVTMT